MTKYDEQTYTPEEIRELMTSGQKLPTLVASALVAAIAEEGYVLPFNVYERMYSGEATTTRSQPAAYPSSPAAP